MGKTIKVLVITGSMGAGKTTILGEASDLLTTAGIPHAAIDLDALGLAHPPSGTSPYDLAYRNLAVVWQNYAAVGIERAVIAGALESAVERGHLYAAIPHSEIVICRLTAPLATMRARVAAREQGVQRERYVARVAELEKILDEAHLEDHAIANDGFLVTETARAVLAAAGWL